ncbi:hypothetical protein DXG03_006031 [Asterophora parasitica]|uniref:Uncharacterized protein n=1 Tax=Asterophora parasitica TaxID=117018 RepID=A0A9P7G913_9AGAR|nr:hypothetical protein DXG03_006031 [Asterophora parasitica]
MDEAAEKLETLLLEMKALRLQRELAEREAEVEKEQRSIAKEARWEAMFRDLTHIEEGVHTIKKSQHPTQPGKSDMSMRYLW